MNFNPDLPLKSQSLDKKIIEIFREQADSLYDELKKNKNKIILVPAPRQMHHSHKIRKISEYNPFWYSDLYWNYYPNFRRDRTYKSLNRIINLNDMPFKKSKYKYDSIMREFIYKILIEGYYYKYSKTIPENLEFKEYFKK